MIPKSFKYIHTLVVVLGQDLTKTMGFDQGVRVTVRSDGRVRSPSGEHERERNLNGNCLESEFILVCYVSETTV